MSIDWEKISFLFERFCVLHEMSCENNGKNIAVGNSGYLSARLSALRGIWLVEVADTAASAIVWYDIDLVASLAEAEKNSEPDIIPGRTLINFTPEEFDAAMDPKSAERQLELLERTWWYMIENFSQSKKLITHEKLIHLRKRIARLRFPELYRDR